MSVVTRNVSLLSMELKQMAGKFEGKVSQDLKAIEGAWTQGGANLPLLLNRVKVAAEPGE